MDWNEFIGQTEIKEELEAILASNMPIPHILFYGGWGVGKTTLAKLFADKLADKLEFRTACLDYSQSFNELFSGKNSWIYNVGTQKELYFPEWANVYIVDEIHALSRPEKLYLLMEEKVLVGCTTRIGKMNLPLRSRFVEFTFRDYAEKELEQIIKVAIKDYYELDDLTLNEIAKRSRGIPRNAINLAFRLIRFFEANDMESCPEMIDRVCVYYGIDENGLTVQDEKYLNALRKVNRPMGLTALSGMSGLDLNTIQLIVEPFLLKKGYIAITNLGRILI